MYNTAPVGSGFKPDRPRRALTPSKGLLGHPSDPFPSLLGKAGMGLPNPTNEHATLTCHVNRLSPDPPTLTDCKHGCISGTGSTCCNPA